MQQVLYFCNSRMLSLEERIIIFKKFTISKISFITFLDSHSKLIDQRN